MLVSASVSALITGTSPARTRVSRVGTRGRSSLRTIATSWICSSSKTVSTAPTLMAADLASSGARASVTQTARSNPQPPAPLRTGTSRQPTKLTSAVPAMATSKPRGM